MIPAATIKEEPAGAARYLLPNEDCVAMVRRHPAVLLPASAYAVAGLLAAFILSATLLRGHTTLILIIWGLWGVLMVRLIWQAINWAVDYFVITSKRILLTSGVFTRSVASRVCDEIFNQGTEKKGKEDKKGEVLQELDDFELGSEMIANRNPLPEVPDDTYLMDASDDPADEA